MSKFAEVKARHKRDGYVVGMGADRAYLIDLVERMRPYVEQARIHAGDNVHSIGLQSILERIDTLLEETR